MRKRYSHSGREHSWVVSRGVESCYGCGMRRDWPGARHPCERVCEPQPCELEAAGIEPRKRARHA
jgi:hypothetical protein